MQRFSRLRVVGATDSSAAEILSSISSSPVDAAAVPFGDVGQRRCVLAWLCLVVSQPSAIAVVFVTLPPRSLTNLVGTQIVLPHIGEGGVDFPLVIAQPSFRYGPKNHLKRMRGHQDRNSCNRRGDQKQHRVVYCFSYVMPAPRAPPGPSPKHALCMLPTLTMPPIKNWISMIIPCEIAGCPHSRPKLAGRFEKREGLP